MTNNLLIQIMGKLGIKYFILDSKTPYDYIMGLDTGLGILVIIELEVALWYMTQKVK